MRWLAEYLADLCVLTMLAMIVAFFVGSNGIGGKLAEKPMVKHNSSLYKPSADYVRKVNIK
jgi:hypothetical protein